MLHKGELTDQKLGGDELNRKSSRAVLEHGPRTRNQVLQALLRVVLFTLMVIVLVARYHGLALTGMHNL